MMSLFSYFSSKIYICPFEHLAHALSFTAHSSLVIESWVQITHTSCFHNNAPETGVTSSFGSKLLSHVATII